MPYQIERYLQRELGIQKWLIYRDVSGEALSMLSDDQGSTLVKLARGAVTNYLQQKPIPSKPSVGNFIKAGTFVTLYLIDGKKRETLRGCVGFPIAEKPIEPSIVDSALAAAFEDPRFPPLEPGELDRVIFEVSVLTEPQEINGDPKARASMIQVGRDGLILRWKYGSGLLLPLVPVEMKWRLNDYLANICSKAGAPLDEWSKPSSKLYTFQAIVFKELEPNGSVERLSL